MNYVSTYVCIMYVRTYVLCMYVCIMYVRTYVLCMYVCIMYVRTYVLCMYVCIMYICMYVGVVNIIISWYGLQNLVFLHQVYTSHGCFHLTETIDGLFNFNMYVQTATNVRV